MATSALMAAGNHHHQSANNAGASVTHSPLHHQDHDPHHLPIRRSSGRRKSNGSGCDSSSSAGQKKKQPQRGMGVEKLERLRLQEGLRKLQPDTNIQGFNINTTQAAFADPTLINTSVPVQLSKIRAGTFVPQIGFGPNQQVGYLGFPGQMLAGGLVCDHRHKVACFASLDFVGKNISTVASGISKVLPSNPNTAKCFSEHCNVCHKKKKVTGEDLGRADMYPQMCKFGSECGFLGLNLGDNQNVISQENGEGFEAKPPLPRQLGFVLGNGNQVGEVVAVHRKGSSPSSSSSISCSEGGNVVMEYEFFPLGCCRNNDELGLRKQQLVGGSEYQTCSSSSSSTSSSMAAAAVSAGIFDASTCIDLSLKLSY